MVRKSRIRGLVPLMLLLLVIACGTITIDIETVVRDEDDITHDISMEVSGPIATAMQEGTDEETINPLEDEFFDDNCDVVIDEVDGEDRIEVSCTGISHEELSASAEEGEGPDIQVTREDLGDKWEYRATAVNILYDVEDEEWADTPLPSGLVIDQVLKARYYWTVTMPGEIVETNADSTDNGQAKFTGKIGDKRETFVAVSHKEKPKGLFGDCSFGTLN